MEYERCILFPFTMVLSLWIFPLRFIMRQHHMTLLSRLLSLLHAWWTKFSFISFSFMHHFLLIIITEFILYIFVFFVQIWLRKIKYSFSLFSVFYVSLFSLLSSLLPHSFLQMEIYKSVYIHAIGFFSLYGPNTHKISLRGGVLD